ncbi:MAG: hypothetical protein ACE5HI_19460 [bacterium]
MQLHARLTLLSEAGSNGGQNNRPGQKELMPIHDAKQRCFTFS